MKYPVKVVRIQKGFGALKDIILSVIPKTIQRIGSAQCALYKKINETSTFKYLYSNIVMAFFLHEGAFFNYVNKMR